jgi:hypothetical protein
MWVVQVKDPDGYKISFESFTDVPKKQDILTGKNGIHPKSKLLHCPILCLT